MLGNITVGHMFLGGGDRPEVKHVSTGLLGADYKIENGRYRFAHVYNGENWNPDTKAPLTQPGVNVTAGDYLLAVNGRELRATDNIYSFFEATAGKTVLLKVGADPAGAGAREVKVVPVDDEFRLRHLAWIEENRRKVDQATNQPRGVRLHARHWLRRLHQLHALLLRAGGQAGGDHRRTLQSRRSAGDRHRRVPAARKPMSVVTTRDGADMVQPQGAIFGPKVMIINEFAGSGGDAMPWYFRRAGVGKLIGERTWGGLVGLSGYPELMDGGVVYARRTSRSGIRTGLSTWRTAAWRRISKCELDPAAVRQGHDPQLEKAIEVVMQELTANPPAEYKRPPYPNYQKK